VLVGPILQIEVALFGNEQISLREVLLVRVELLLKEGSITASVLLSEVTHLVLVLLLHLSLLVAEILLLRLDDDVQLRLLALDLFNKLLQVGNLLEVLDFLRGDLLVKHVLLFLVSDLPLQLALPDQNCL